MGNCSPEHGKSALTYKSYYNLDILSTIVLLSAIRTFPFASAVSLVRILMRYDYQMLGSGLAPVLQFVDVICFILLALSIAAIPNILLIKIKAKELIYAYVISDQLIGAKYLWRKPTFWKWASVTSVRIEPHRATDFSRIEIVFEDGHELHASGLLLEHRWNDFVKDVCSHVPEEKIVVW